MANDQATPRTWPPPTQPHGHNSQEPSRVPASKIRHDQFAIRDLCRIVNCNLVQTLCSGLIW